MELASTAERTNESPSIKDSTTFPVDFVWGVATSAFQIEGGATSDGKGPSIWDVFCREEGRIVDRSDGAVACDHYRLWADDVALMSTLGLDAYRFSIAWPRVVPGGVGAVNQEGLDFYDRLVDGLLEAGITPSPTLYHWDLPQALGERGGWLSRDTSEAFAEYSAVVVERLGDRVQRWMTLNEPYCSAHLGYAKGEHAPGHTDLGEALDASHHLMLAHGLGVQAIRAAAPHVEVGIVLNFTPAEPETDQPADVGKARLVNDIENRWYADAITGRGYPAETAAALEWNGDVVLDGDLDIVSTPIDALGVNFYTRSIVSAVEGRVVPRPGGVTDMGWEIHPPALGGLLRDLHDRYGFVDYMITENGCAMPDDQRTSDGVIDDQDRIDYLDAHLRQVHRAIADGVPVTGYYAWSFMDNFEWAHGYEKRFGLVEVDYETLERRPKRSALWYADVIAADALPETEI